MYGTGFTTVVLLFQKETNCVATKKVDWENYSPPAPPFKHFFFRMYFVLIFVFQDVKQEMLALLEVCPTTINRPDILSISDFQLACKW